MRVLNKIAFLVHEPVMYAHYSSVWAAMDPRAFVIVFLGPIVDGSEPSNPDARLFLNRIQAMGYETAYLEELVASNIKYQYVVSNHIMGGCNTQPAGVLQTLSRVTKNVGKKILNVVSQAIGVLKKFRYEIDPFQYIPLQAGIKQIRFMYGADISDAWSLDAWNEIYDLFLCHGPNDEMHLKKRFKGKTAVMGYPRYDGYFSPDLNIDDVLAEFAIDHTKKTILWMPTYDAFKDNVCSIPYFAEKLSRLKGEFNIIVRPHPISFRLDQAGIQLLQSFNFKIDSDAARDMNKLFRVADTILCDHGGSAFGALYLGKKLVFLKTPTANTASVVKESSNLELMKHFPIIETEQVDALGALIADASYWDERLGLGRALSDKYFANYRGNASQKTAKILAGLDSILS